MLSLCNICKSFPSLFAPVLQKISFTLERGDFCIVIGSNGSGKSTLMQTISGQHQTDGGQIILGEQELTSMPMHRRAAFISSVTQETTSGIVKEMTLLENLCLSQMRGQKAKFSFYKKKQKVLEAKVYSFGLGLEKYLHIPMHALSGGEQQIIATAMATLSEPQLLLLDEHCSALDPKRQLQLMEYTAKVIAEQNITALMVTHNFNDAVGYGNRLIMLHQGQVVLNLSPREKQALTARQLLELFHRYEDSTLVQNLLNS